MFAICIESSHSRGMGHLFRGLHLATALRENGHSVKFLINNNATSLEILMKYGYEPLVVNLLDLSSGWEKSLVTKHGFRIWINDRLDTLKEHASLIKEMSIPLVTFDDRGSGAALADLHVAALSFQDYQNLAGIQVLQGVDYLILNPEISNYQRERYLPNSILVSLGGSDTYGVTVRVVEQLIARGRGATIVIGPEFSHQEALESVLTSSFEVLQGVESMAREMFRHDLAITGGGITPFEAAAAGLPCIVVANEYFEVPVCRALEGIGVAVFAGHHEHFDLSALDRPLSLNTMSRLGLENIGLMGTKRVINAFEELLT